MPYINGMVCSVPTAQKAAFVAHARQVAAVFKEYGALSVNDGWGDEVPDGQLTSFPMAVQCEPDETVCFCWIVWPSKGIQAGAWPKIMADPRLSPETNPMPFDGKRAIFGGFELVLEA